GALTIADFNRDGVSDIAVIHTALGKVFTLLGRQGASYLQSGYYPAGLDPYRIVAGDFNGDQNPDVLVSTYGSSRLSLLAGDGAGGFSNPTEFETEVTTPSQMTITDFDGDQKPDLVVGNGSRIRVLLGLGAGAFAAPLTVVPVPENLSFAVE